ncbi:MAG: hypothetical protein IT454_03040 [Planctomycetes bacterium]|nr:hypothetical protein [Planctomycetota bacterium]
MRTLALVLALCAAQQSDLEQLLEALDSARGARVEALSAELAKRGRECASRVLAPAGSAFAALPVEARRARSALLAEWGGSDEVLAALALADDVDLDVRSNFALFLARGDVRGHEEERVRTLGQLASASSTAAERELFARSLTRLDCDAAARALRELCERAAGSAQLEFARALAAHPRARGPLVECVLAALRRERDGLGAPALAALLESGFGAALAETPAGGEAGQDLGAFARAARHPDERVQRAARVALERFASRASALGDVERAERVLAALSGSGFDDDMLLELRVELALETSEGAQRAFDLACELVRRNALDQRAASRIARARGDLMAAAAAVALERLGDAEPFLADAEACAAAVRRERWDLRQARGRSTVDERALDDHLLEALVPAYRAWIALLQGQDPSSSAVLGLAREADRRLLETHLWLSRSVFGYKLSHDELLQHPLGPASLSFARSKSAASARDRNLDVELALYRALATVAKDGLPGFEPFDTVDASLSDPLTDPERRRLLQLIQVEQWETVLGELERQIDELRRSGSADDLLAARELEFTRYRYNQMFTEEQSRGGDRALRNYRGVSRAGLVFAERLRENGRAESARRTAERVARDLESARGVLDDLSFTRTLAAAESALGGACMDLDQPTQADEVFTRALERLRGAEAQLVSEGDTTRVAGVRSQIAGMLTSLAVNANVKLRDPARALEHFEQAYALDQSDFMRVMLACYRARAGRADDARAALASVVVSPNNYYNLACTYALLGERELALDFLARDFEALRKSDGARERQKQWARSDPDLASLAGDARFQALLHSESAEARKK